MSPVVIRKMPPSLLTQEKESCNRGNLHITNIGRWTTGESLQCTDRVMVVHTTMSVTIFRQEGVKRFTMTIGLNLL